MSNKRSRGQMVLEQHRKTESTIATNAPDVKKKGEVLSPVKKLMGSPTTGKESTLQATASTIQPLPSGRFSDTVSRLISTFKTINNAVSSLQMRRKQCPWRTVVESYQTISSDSLEIDDLLEVLSIWREAFTLRWQVKTTDSHNNPRSYELVVEIPHQSTTSIMMDVQNGPNAQSPSAPQRLASAPVVSASQLHFQRIGTYTDKVYALVEKALAANAVELGIHPDPSLLPVQPEIAPAESVVTTTKAAKDILEWEKEAVRKEDRLEEITLDVLRARAVEREKQVSVQEQLRQHKIENEEHTKLLQLLPAMADAVRSLARRKNRTRMPKKDCIENVVTSMHIKYASAVAGLEQLHAIIPEFFSMERPEAGVPATVHIDTALPYKEVRGFIVEYVKQQCITP